MSSCLYLGVVLSSKQHPWLQFKQGWVASTTWQVNEVTFRGGSWLSHSHVPMEVEIKHMFSLYPHFLLLFILQPTSFLTASHMVLYSTSYSMIMMV